MPRLANDVISDLLREKRKIVTDLPPKVCDTGNTIDDLIDGTAVFPGGSGLWRGEGYFGRLPEYFPDFPIMVIGHNFDSDLGHWNSRARGGEVQSPHTFWGILLAYLRSANVRAEECFFTNVLMGLKPGKATGSMPPSPTYESQCQRFLIRQIEIAQPRFLIVLGGKALRRVVKTQPKVPWHASMHPSAREFKPLATRDQRTQAQGQAIAKSIQANAYDR